MDDTASILESLKEALSRKDSVGRIMRFTEVLNECIANDTAVFDSGSLLTDTHEFEKLVSHAEQLWNDSRSLLGNRSFASAVAISITAIEEVGKVSVARFVVAINQQRRDQGIGSSGPNRKNAFYSHRKKHQLAAFAGFAVNSRADRILGLENILALFDLVEKDRLENLRQNSLYSESVNGQVRTPLSIRTEMDAIFFCTITGELLMEVGGFVPEEFQRLAALVAEFEAQHPLPKDYRLTIRE